MTEKQVYIACGISSVVSMTIIVLVSLGVI
jgi:hypothetical protein